MSGVASTELSLEKVQQTASAIAESAQAAAYFTKHNILDIKFYFTLV